MVLREARGFCRSAALTFLLALGGVLQPAPRAEALAPPSSLDSRAWELVSPAEKNGGEVALVGAGVLRAAAPGGAVAFASTATFGEAAGAAPVSQYVATRSAGGWSTANVTPPLLSGTYSAGSGDADPYLAFSADLSRALLSGGWACRAGGSECEAEAPPLGPGGPPGYRNLYLLEGGAYAPLITAANFGGSLPPDPSEFHLAFVEASPSLDCVVFETGSGSYEWRAGTISPLAGGCGGGGFVPPGAIAVLGASADESVVFYVAGDGIYRWQEGAGTRVVADANLAHLPPETGPSAVSADGSRLFFTAADPLLPLSDSNGRADAYEWEAQGSGSCTTAPGCLGLLSSGRSGEATFAAASADGADAYFLTAASLLPADADGLTDLYDARAGGGFPEPEPQIECVGDACQSPPPAPDDPAPPTSFVSGPANPPAKFPQAKCPKGKHRVVRKNKPHCVPKHHPLHL